jgi:Icc-related predicted phosphoesterase
MRLLALTDIHDKPESLGRILADAPPCDLILLGGDITNFGSVADAERLVGQVRQLGKPVLGVAGNCDSPQIEQRLVDLGISLFRRGEIRGGMGLQGLSAMPPWRRMYQFTEEELANHLREGHAAIAGADRHVVLSHAPPHGCKVDRTFLMRHVGSKALRAFVDEHQPDLVVCGHIHEARGVDRIGETRVVNCGPAAEGSYASVDLAEPLSIEIRRA